MEDKLKHLEFIQNVITRMNSNSFLIKGFSITIMTALIALSASNSNKDLILIVYFQLFIFWILDAYYLGQERKYRNLYEDILEKKEKIDFSMDATKSPIIREKDSEDIVKIKEEKKKNAKWHRAFFFSPNSLFYLLQVILSMAILYFTS